MLASIHPAVAKLEASLAALCDSDRLLREFMVRTSMGTSLADIHRDAQETASAVRAISQTALYDVKQGS